MFQVKIHLFGSVLSPLPSFHQRNDQFWFQATLLIVSDTFAQLPDIQALECPELGRRIMLPYE
jgi:hypothetical protein